MKRTILIILLFLLLLEGVALAALTYDENYFMTNISNMLSGSTTDNPLYLFMNESIGYLEGSTGFTKVYFDPQSTAPTSPSEGDLYYRNSGDVLRLYTAAGWVSLDTAGASSLDTAYGISGSVTVDAGAIVFTTTDAADTPAFGVIQGDTGSVVGMTIQSAGTGALLAFTSDGTGNDMLGTGSTWSMSKAGVATLVGATISTSDLTFLENANDPFVIRSDTKDELEIASGLEDVSFGFGTSNTLTMSSDSGVVAMDFGPMVTVSGISTLTGSTASDFTIQVTSDTASEDLVIQQLGSGAYSVEILSAGTGTDSILIQATKGIDIDSNDDLNIRNTASASDDDFHIRLEGEHDASLILSSDGTGDDALSLLTDDSSGSGDVDITSGDDIDLNAADDITVDTSDGSYSLTTAGSVLGDVTLSVADDFANTIVGHHTLTVTGSSTVAITGSLTITGTSNGLQSIYIRENGGTAGTIVIHNDQGTGASSIHIDSDDGSIDIDAGDNLDIDVADNYTMNTADGSAVITVGGASDGDLMFIVGDDYDERVTGNHYVLVGGSMTTTVTGSMTYTVAGSLTITGTAGGSKTIYIRENAGVTGHILIHADQGLGENSIDLDSDVGGIHLHADAGPITIDATGGSLGDMDLTIGDDYTNTVAGDYTLAVTGTTTLGDIRFLRAVSVTANAVVVLSPSMSGMVFVTTASTGSQTFQLPLAAVGLTFTFVDVSATGGDDVFVLANTSDKINGGSAAEYYRSITDAVPTTVTVVAADGTDWVITSEVGTWSNSD